MQFACRMEESVCSGGYRVRVEVAVHLQWMMHARWKFQWKVQGGGCNPLSTSGESIEGCMYALESAGGGGSYTGEVDFLVN